MDNLILEKIKKFAISELQKEYGYCGSAEGDDSAMLNADDGNGNDIKINIESKPEQETVGGYTDDDGGNLPNG